LPAQSYFQFHHSHFSEGKIVTRLQKKCLIGSACFHGLTAAVFLVTSAFRSEPPVTTEQVITLIPTTAIVDGPTHGGDPLPAAAKPQPAQPALSSPPAQPPAPTPLAPHPAEPPKTEVKNTPKPPAPDIAPEKPSLEPAPKKPKIDVDLTQNTPPGKKPLKNADTAAQTRAAAQAASKKLAKGIAEAFAGLESSAHSPELSSKVVSPSTGSGGEGGGEAFVNYGIAIRNAYYQAWIIPDGTTHNLAVTEVRIVVQRDGTVTLAEIVSKSGDNAVDRSVQRALDAVHHLPPFPPGAQDAERTFSIGFNLKAKQEDG
jgi:protein TonB